MPLDDYNGIKAFVWFTGTGVIGYGGKYDGVGVIGNGGEKLRNGGVGVVGNGQYKSEGIVGYGGNNQGTGVRGLGSGVPRVPGGDSGISGGIGVHGEGGSWEDFNPEGPPGIGVLGVGGRQDFNRLRQPHGAGVVGIAGLGIIPDLKDTGNVGVYGQGAIVEEYMTNIEGLDVFVGPKNAGPGILGRGGVPILHDRDQVSPSVAAGVIGLAGNTPIPQFDFTCETGVYGKGPRGVVGETDRDVGEYLPPSSYNVGVYGLASNDTGRGGVFESKKSAQVKLVPQRRIVVEIGQNPRMPKDGEGGDLMCTVEGDRSKLWFCVKSGTGDTPARWAQVLLGLPFDGQV